MSAALSTLATATTMASCSGSGETAAPAGSQSESIDVRAAERSIVPAGALPAKPLLYVSSYDATATSGVYVYLKDGTPNQSPLAKLGGPPNQSNDGIAVDRAGNLYVTNRLASQILFYPARFLQPTKTLIDPGKYPGSVAVGNDGTVYVGNQETTS
ncbi:MAG: hypothetical protein IAI50_15140, partial [Candidatus Eremiobacteraeota bacterium]|nr:hypothetical protein [Candidatus Eremiobacteraeota bacterium]